MKEKLLFNISEDAEFDATLSMRQNKRSAKEIEEVLFDLVEEQIKVMYCKREADIEFILRNKIDKPIKGI